MTQGGQWPNQPTLVRFNDVYANGWYLGAAPPADPNAVDDFQLLAQHEIGHALGLDHSTMGYAPGSGVVTEMPVMRGSYPRRRTLSVDDKIAISTVYDTWTQIDNDTSHVGVGMNGDVWAVAGSDHTVWKRNNSNGGWDSIGGDAGPISVGQNGQPFVIAGWGDGTIWFWSSNNPFSGSWQQVTGAPCATDIAAGPAVGTIGLNDLWIIRCDGNPDGTIWKRSSNGTWVQDASGGRAVRIALGSDGRPWVANFIGDVYRYSTNGTNGYWERMLQSDPIHGIPAADDIAVGPGDYPWIVDRFTG